MKNILKIISLSIIVIGLSSCLTVEKKEYIFELKDNNSGTLTIKYINILSLKDDTTDISKADFAELINNYIDGTEINDDYPNALVRSKRLFEEKGVLCGEVIIDFEDLNSIGLYQYDNKCPYMFNVGSFLEGESFLNSNGDFGGDVMPVVFWPKSLKTLTLTTYINSPDDSTVSLLAEYNNWK